MYKFLGIGLAMVMFVGCASAQTSAPASAPAPPTAPAAPKTISPASDIDDVLDALDARGKNLSDFTADVSLTDVDNANGTDSTLAGKIWMQKLSGGAGDDARLRVTFDKRITNGKEKADKSEYTLDKGWLIDRKYADRQEVRRQVLKPGQKMNLLKLGEGPFPLPLGQDKADVHRLFDVKKIDAGKDDPAGTIHVQLIPKSGTQFENRFKTIDFWVDPASAMPVRIQTLDRNETTTRTTELKDVTIDSKLSDKDFELTKISEGEWKITEAPYED